MKAVIIKETGKAAVADVKEQSPRSNFIKIKTVAVAINPTDFHHTGGSDATGCILGLDVAGIVQEVGPSVTSNVKPGDRVFGVCHGGNNANAEDGAFAEYALIKDGLFARVPKNISTEQAASMGVGVNTVAQTLYQCLKLPIPGTGSANGASILINGGSTASGTLAIQYAKLSGCTVVATSSPHNFELLKSRGADAVFDYNDPEAGQKIREFTGHRLQYALDVVGTAAGFKLVADAFPASSNGHFVTVLPPEDMWTRKDVNLNTILSLTTFGEPIKKFSLNLPAMPEHYEIGKQIWALNAQLVEQGKVVPHPVTIGKGGLFGVLTGITAMSFGGWSGTKMVYRTGESEAASSGAAETPFMSNYRLPIVAPSLRTRAA